MFDILVNIDWTPLIEAIIAIAGAALVSICYKYVVPWLRENHQLIAAQIAVEAAEAAFGRYNGEEKWRAALESLKQKGFNINSEEVIAAVKAAWKQLDQKQLTAGEKVVDECEKKSEPQNI